MVILGGTAEARALAERLAGRPGLRVVSTLAGRVREPRLPAGEVRVGGFGGPDGLATWLRAQQATAVVDATHPFAERISASAATAAAQAGVPIVSLRRPGWEPIDGDDWRWVGSLDQAAQLLPSLGTRAFLTTGRQGLAAFAHLTNMWFLVRCVDLPEPPLPPRMRLLLSRGPYTVDGEARLLLEVDTLVTKDSGGDLTSAKLAAARQLRLPVVIVRRPAPPDMPTVATVDAAIIWMHSAVE